MPLFRIKNEISPKDTFPLSEGDLHHLQKVLRIKLNDRFEIISPSGQRAEARLIQEDKTILGKVDKLLPFIPIPQIPLWVGIGMIRWSRMEWFVEKATELGVARITPLSLGRSRFDAEDDKLINKIKRLKKISEESLKQCERNEALQIDSPQTLNQFLQLCADTSDPSQNFLFLERSQAPIFSEKILEIKPHYRFLIGPEGGFAPKEITEATKAGFTPVSLGLAPLRTETAGLYGTCVLDTFLRSMNKN